MLLMRCSPQAGIQSTCDDGLERALAQSRLLHADEPLRRCAKNDRRFVTPAMRIGMMIRLILEQTAVVVQHFDHMRVGVEYLFARKQRRRGRKRPSPPTGFSISRSVAAADDVVIQAMARAPCAPRRCRHRASHDRPRPPAPAARRRDAAAAGARALRLWRSRSSSNAATPSDFMTASINSLATTKRSRPSPIVEFDQCVVELRMHRHRAIRRQRPGGRGPDGERGRHSALASLLGRIAETPRQISADPRPRNRT